jgi:uncharacterized protein (UPF0212 family)
MARSIPLKLTHTTTKKVFHASSIEHAKRILKIKNNNTIKTALKNKTPVKKYKIIYALQKNKVVESDLNKIPECYDQCPCTYLFSFIDKNSDFIKYGMSRKIMMRLKDHRRTFGCIRKLHVFPCVSIEHAEKTEKLFEKYAGKYKTSVVINGKNKTEILRKVPIATAALLMKVVKELITEQCIRTRTISFPEFCS